MTLLVHLTSFSVAGAEVIIDLSVCLCILFHLTDTTYVDRYSTILDISRRPLSSKFSRNHPLAEA
ncbi:uncharacterized protein BDW43DRAFT_293708 [Aspergillus alliaceus]|uniref:uncharacterized protein n=1 Tax=Petromyces alliaceus TaxID=209559 RepID=UPI0012A5B9C5|nr:uncharacterized protein BDW43DRAFT_293708 [Aspergillus alliaceus]KAB8227571.1 hypothetical protein BDW43DRAFT_293708 [Aspergillus alliaceus]